MDQSVLQALCHIPSFLLERVLVQLVRDPGIHQRGDGVDLVLLTELEKLPVPVRVLHGDRVSHGERHHGLIEDEPAVLGHRLYLAERNRLGPSSLNHLLQPVRTVLGFSAVYEFLGVVWIETHCQDIILVLENMVLKILVDDHEIENASVEDLKRRLLQKLLVLLTSGAR